MKRCQTCVYYIHVFDTGDGECNKKASIATTPDATCGGWTDALPSNKTCEHCKHWTDFNDNEGWCDELTPYIIPRYDEPEDVAFMPSADFGCNKWEAKE
jgi:hypothetical protein